ncbi:hypothetical protein EROM_082030 [Encephalitozoon romaleae SJ-2008]|uniref:Uncharacterized protein n=1 Tax=Encephalitozoon romaleae (strain SJ-2008) TaxID=1178016 RepID=I7AT39_ENCRO|nr:hypothetical protein EROM_082030 [Encephalitozoon romaleae SJ-2008]AFN83617.1 hypothetical protein EROM_082030 [Encephalitozoon romaleae SJ-2008]
MNENSSSSHQSGGLWQSAFRKLEVFKSQFNNLYSSLLGSKDNDPSSVPESAEADFIDINPFNRNFFFILYCLTTLGLLFFSCIVKGSVQSNKKMEMGIDVLLFLVSVAGPIMYGMWILMNEYNDNGIENVIKNNWNIVGSMIPIIIGILNGKVTRRYRIMMAGLGIIMIYVQKIVQEKIHKGQLLTLIIGNAVMISVYLIKLVNEGFEDEYEIVICIVPIVIAIGLIVIDMLEEKKEGSEVNSEMKNIVCVMSWIVGTIGWYLGPSA